MLKNHLLNFKATLLKRDMTKMGKNTINLRNQYQIGVVDSLRSETMHRKFTGSNFFSELGRFNHTQRTVLCLTVKSTYTYIYICGIYIVFDETCFQIPFRSMYFNACPTILFGYPRGYIGKRSMISLYHRYSCNNMSLMEINHGEGRSFKFP